MPAIFNDKNREQVRSRMLENGFELIKKYGAKKMTIEDLTKASGLAKGTFYTFFPSKEEFVYQILLYKREGVRQMFQEYVTKYGVLKREHLEDFFLTIRNFDHNLYAYLTDDDITYLAARWPEKYMKDPEADELTSKWMISFLDIKNPDADWRIFANFMKSFALLDMNKELLHQEAYDDLLKLYRDAVLDYYFSDHT